jgi:hypothetical protein
VEADKKMHREVDPSAVQSIEIGKPILDSIELIEKRRFAQQGKKSPDAGHLLA